MIIEALQPLAVPIKNIHPDPRNARTHNDRNLATIKKSLETYGQRKPIVCNHDGVIEAGNGLYLAAVALGWTEIAAVYVNDDADYAKGYGVMDNQSALLADWDLPTLKDLLQELDTGAFDMDATGFDTHELEMLMTQEHQGDVPHASLAERFIVPPFSVLDARQGYWQARKAAWLALGIQSELGRGGGLTLAAVQVTSEGLNYYRHRTVA
jgi:ParB-like chromosome segregation protein Spo0J